MTLFEQFKLNINRKHRNSTNDEKKVDAGKRSIYISEKINEGEVITTKNIKVIRPGFGLHPRYYTDVLGKKANKNLF